VLLGYLFAGILLFIGQQQIKKNRDSLGQVLLGGSVVLLFIVTFAMHVLYGMVPALPSLLLNVIWIGLGIYLAHRYHSEPLSILTGIGGYLIPFLIENKDPTVLNFVSFETVFYIALLLFAMRKTFTILYHMAFALLHVTLLAGLILIAPINVKIFGLAVIIQHLFLVTTFFMQHSFIKQQIGVLFTSFLLTMAWVNGTFADTQYELVVLISFGVYSLLSWYIWAKNKERLSATLSISTVALFIFLVSRFDVENVVGLLIIQGILSIYLGTMASSKIKQLIGVFIYFISSILTIGHQFETIMSIEFINWLILLGSIILVLKLLPSFKDIKETEREKLKQIICAIALILLLAFITLTVGALTQALTLNIQYMSVSFAWAIYAFMGIILGSTRDNKLLRIFGLVLLFFTLAKLVFVDLAYISIVIRAILFIGIGLIGVAGSRVFYKAQSK
jgi:uncharacterized membrane protein